jgi:hypothetical protein
MSPDSACICPLLPDLNAALTPTRGPHFLDPAESRRNQALSGEPADDDSKYPMYLPIIASSSLGNSLTMNYARRVNLTPPKGPADILQRALRIVTDTRAATFTMTAFDGERLYESASAAAIVRALLLRLYHGNALALQNWDTSSKQLDAVDIDPTFVSFATAAECLVLPHEDSSA